MTRMKQRPEEAAEQELVETRVLFKQSVTR